jgi:16S rRNA processing protein RimM
MLRLDDLIQIGFIKKAHGYKGQVKLQITLPAAEELETEHVFLEIEGKPVPFFIEDISGPEDQWIVMFEGVGDEEKARQIVGSKVYVASDLFPDLDRKAEVSVFIGMKVHDSNLGELGTITAIIEKTGQDLLEMEFNNKIILIPFAEELITKVDVTKKILFVNLPDGLMDLAD